MKRKKSINASAMAPDQRLERGHSNRMPRIEFATSWKHMFLVLAVLLCCMAVTTQAENIECAAGYSCQLGETVACEQGWYSLDGDIECYRCPEGMLLLNLSRFLKTMYRILLSHHH